MRGLCAQIAALLLVLLPTVAACQRETAAPPLTVVAPGHGSGVIAWWSRQQTPVAQFAASELQRYLGRMGGTALPVVRGAFDRPPPANVSAALVLLTGPAAGDASAPLQARWTARLTGRLGDPQDDAFAAQVVGGDRVVLVAAGDRGILDAAYDLLGRLGVRFFAPSLPAYQGHAEEVPRRAVVAIPPYETAQRAGLRYRVKDLDEGWSVGAQTLGPLVDWMGKARLDVLAVPYDLASGHVIAYDSLRSQLTPLLAQRGIIVEVGQHGYEDWLPRSAYPQFYQPGYSVFDIADDEAVSAYVGAVTGYLSHRPEIGVFDAWPPDNATWPPSVLARFGSASNAQAYLVRRLTEAVATRLPAGVRIETIAYQETTEPPGPAYAYDPARTTVDVALSGRTYAAPISAPANARSAALLDRWRHAFAGDLGAYEYYRKYAFRSLPVPLPDVIGADLPWYQHAGVTRIRTYAEPADWLTYELTHLQVAALAWDPSQAPDSFVTDYLGDRYGPAAPAVQRYLRDAESASIAELFAGPGDQVRLSAAVAGFAAASADLAAAGTLAPATGAAAFLVQRLGWNADFAQADAQLGASLAAGDLSGALGARLAGAALLSEHRFDGVLLDEPRNGSRYGVGGPTPQDYAAAYRGAGVVLAAPAGPIVLAPGGRASVMVTAQAADLGTHRVRWSASAGGAAVRPSTGALTVSGGRPASAAVIVVAGRDQGRARLELQVDSDAGRWSSEGLHLVVAAPGDLSPYFDSTAVAPDAGPAGGGFDGGGCSYSAQALAAGGAAPGRPLLPGGRGPVWPATHDAPDNVLARGQSVALPAASTGSRLVLVAAATAGPAEGAGWVTYADGGRAAYQLEVPDWTSGQPAAKGPPVVARSAYRVCGDRQVPGAASVFAVEVPLDPGRAVASVVLPYVLNGSGLHVFGLAVD